MQVAVTDFSFPSLEIEEAILRPLGHEIVSGQCKTRETLIPIVQDADAVIVQFAPIKADVIAAMKKARVIVRYGIGVDNIDLVAARERGIPVCNVPDYCIDEVADHTLAFILGLTRQVVPNTLFVRKGQWGLPVPLDQMRTLRDLTVGVVGFGRIGREVFNRLAPFKCHRLVHDPVVRHDLIRASGGEPCELNQIIEQSDILTLHCPSTAQTRRLLNVSSISRMKPGSIVINLARGDLVETAALIEALQSGHLSSAAIDVCDPEPIPADSPLRQMENVIVASHVASVSAKAVRTLRETAANIAAMALRGERLPNTVNGVSLVATPG
ncbi:C-terminal binding protein [Schlesneria paludicola]|uniref:C-terminal binding protein n=1 Tax=Schlesneria paludicola TaxID=360056 RepID=UPI00029A8F06|nr:C-terminal binding protein [Schlesneria paludicola]